MIHAAVHLLSSTGVGKKIEYIDFSDSPGGLLIEPDIEGRTIIIHSGGDNYSDKPLKNGGGKSRIAGGVITNDCPYCKNETYKKLGFVALAGLGLWALKRN